MLLRYLQGSRDDCSVLGEGGREGGREGKSTSSLFAATPNAHVGHATATARRPTHPGAPPSVLLGGVELAHEAGLVRLCV